MNERQIISGSLVKSCRHTAVVFDSVHEAFDEVAELVFSFVPSSFFCAVAARRYDCLGAALADRCHQFVRVVSLVTDDTVRLVLAQEFRRSRHIMFFTRTQPEFHGLALRIYGNV